MIQSQNLKLQNEIIKKQSQKFQITPAIISAIKMIHGQLPVDHGWGGEEIKRHYFRHVKNNDAFLELLHIKPFHIIYI